MLVMKNLGEKITEVRNMASFSHTPAYKTKSGICSVELFWSKKMTLFQNPAFLVLTVYCHYNNLFQKDIEDMIKEGDLDEDGKINFDEFMIIMSSK